MKNENIFKNDVFALGKIFIEFISEQSESIPLEKFDHIHNNMHTSEAEIRKLVQEYC